MPQLLQYGIDALLREAGKYAHHRIALVTNNAAATSEGIGSRMALLKSGLQISKLFSPEHGISVTGADGEKQQHHTDTLTGLPVISLYGDNLSPTEEALAAIDLVLFDIPDAGCRFYTYLWTMTHVMEACALYKKPLYILDRPNPLGAVLSNAEGPWLDEMHCASFIGRWNIPLKHNCTLGELARYFAGTRIKNLDLRVIPVKGYRRYQMAGIDFSFVPTSPALQYAEAAWLYPGTGLLEGIMINEGRGTSFPFQQLGAPWINAEELTAALQMKLNDVNISPVRFTPEWGVYANEVCEGVRLKVKDHTTFKAVQTGLQLLQTLAQLYPSFMEERFYTTHVNPDGKTHLDKLLGMPAALERIKKGTIGAHQPVPEWKTIMQSYLLY